jgi:glycosyltransferase involved in cell wall biosynthesis
VEHLIAAFSGLEGRLVVAGPERGMTVAAPGVLFTGVLEGPERLELLVDADVLAYPSTKEVFGLVPLEGLLCGTPVVVGGDCGCGELIAEAGAGLLVDHGDVDALRRAIRRLLSDRGEARRFVERGRSFIRKNLDYQQIARRHIDLYERLVSA